MATALHQISSRISNEIPNSFHEGVFVMKWPEDTKKSIPNVVTVRLSVDKKGFYLICFNTVTKETECIDISLIHDTRTGTQVSLPTGAATCVAVNFGVPDTTLSSKWLALYYGNAFTPQDLRIINFVFESPNLAREWAERLFRIGHNIRLRNLSSLDCLEKFHSKIVNTLTDSEKKTISVRSLVQFLCRNTRDTDKTQRICDALKHLALPNQMDASMDSKEFTFNRFFRFYVVLVQYHQVEKLVAAISGKHRQYITEEVFQKFLKKQNDPFNDSFKLEQYEKKAKDFIRKYTEHDEVFKDRGMSDESFLRYLLSFDNYIIDPKKLELFMDMNKPLAHYFISSSHNTYLAGSQVAGRSSIEMYRQVLLSGCRCIELDVLESDNKEHEPEIKHKNTPVRSVPFIDVIVAIKEYAFKVTPYPLILSIENHCGARGQAKMARYLVDVFGDNLIKEPLPTHPCEENYPLPSPDDLKYKILIKNNKLDSTITAETTKQNKKQTPQVSESSSGDQTTDSGTVPPSPALSCHSQRTDMIDKSQQDLTGNSSTPGQHPKQCNMKENHRPGFVVAGSYESSDDDFPINNTDPIKLQAKPNAVQQETKATKAMSNLVVYVVPTRFQSFEYAQKRNRCYEMSSHSEDRASTLIREHAKEFVVYNQRQLTRIYPRGTRFDSTNYNPYIYWTVGCQMCALNYQTLDSRMQVNLAFFSFNGACGYIEKPSALCQVKDSFDPRNDASIENVAGYQVFVKVLSGQFLCQDREPSYVDIQMCGMYGASNKRQDTVHVSLKKWNGFQAIYNDSDLDSDKSSAQYFNVTLPEMAALRFTVLSEDGTYIGQSFIPVAHLRPGYRSISLRNQVNIPVNASSLLVFIRIKIHVDPIHQELVDKLTEPLIEKKAALVKSKSFKHENSSTTAFFDETFATMPIRHHGSFSLEPSVNISARKQSVSTEESHWYQKHLIAASGFHDKKTLCKLLSLNEITSKNIVRVDQSLNTRKHRITNDFQRKIEDKEHLLKSVRSQTDESLFDMNVPNVKIYPKSRSRTDVDQMKKILLDEYLKMFHRQEEAEVECLEEYFNQIIKFIEDDYKKQLQKIDALRIKELSRVEEHVRSEIKRETLEIETNEKDRNKTMSLKQKCILSNRQTGDIIKYTLEEMCNANKEILQRNLQINLTEVEDQRTIEMNKILQKYSAEFNSVRSQLEHETNNDETRTTNGN